MSRTILSVLFDLTFDVRYDPPTISVAFTDTDAKGGETHGRTVLTGKAAAALLPSGLIDGINKAIVTQEKDLASPSTMAAKLTAAADLDVQIAAKKAELAALATLPPAAPATLPK